jgi:hypothetical protein
MPFCTVQCENLNYKLQKHASLHWKETGSQMTSNSTVQQFNTNSLTGRANTTERANIDRQPCALADETKNAVWG